MMLKLLVCLHIYYPEQIDYFLDKLDNITGVEWHLVVTYSKLSEKDKEKIRAFRPEVEFLEVENIGYDIWPFIHTVKQIDTEAYDLVMKLHTKRAVSWCRPNIISLRGMEWRNALVDGMLYDKKYFRSLVGRFEKDKSLGMVSSLLSSVTRDYYDREVKEELSRLGLDKKDRHTNMGTMFLMRSDALRPLKSPLVNKELFEDFEPESGVYFHNAHLYERILSHLPVNAGYRHRAMWPIKKDRLKIKLLKAIEPIGKFIFCCEREGAAQNKFVRVMGIIVYREKRTGIMRGKAE